MPVPGWIRSTGAATAIALSSLPFVAVAPGLLDAHRAIDRELHSQHAAVAAAADTSADVAAVIAERTALDLQ